MGNVTENRAFRVNTFNDDFYLSVLSQYQHATAHCEMLAEMKNRVQKSILWYIFFA